MMDWPSIPVGPEAVVGIWLIRTPKESEHSRWVREMNRFRPDALRTRGRKKPLTK